MIGRKFALLCQCFAKQIFIVLAMKRVASDGVHVRSLAPG